MFFPPFLCTGETLAIFHFDGTTPQEKDLLNIVAKEIDNESAQFFRTVFPIPSGPVAFCVSSFFQNGLNVISGYCDVI